MSRKRTWKSITFEIKEERATQLFATVLSQLKANLLHRYIGADLEVYATQQEIDRIIETTIHEHGAQSTRTTT